MKPNGQANRSLPAWLARGVIWLEIIWLVSLYGAVLFGMAILGASMRPLVLPADRYPGPTLVYSSDGKVLAKLYEHYRVPVTIDRIPAHTIHAVLAAEDRRFFLHHGLDWRGVLRAAWVDLRARGFVQGGSTITQQLVRLDMLDDRRSVHRKLREVVLALRVERGMTKREILERYLNAIYFGGGAYGIGAAAESYFRKPVEKLTPAESALLAGLIRAPGAGDPRHHLPVAQRRQRQTLAAMHRLNWLSTAVYRAALAEEIVIRPRPGHPWRAPYVVEWVRQTLVEDYGRDLVYHGGLTVYTTIDSSMQAAAERALENAVRAGRGRRVGNGALVAIDPHNGEIRAQVGGSSFRASQFDRARQAHRQAGSAFKAFVYLAAIQHGMLLTDQALDAPVTIGGYSPKNYGDQYFGQVTLETALARSLNSVAVRVTEAVGPRAVARAAQQAGITSSLGETHAIALGAYEVTPLEMARAFATFANGGKRVETGMIREIRRGNEVIYRRQPAGRQQVSPADAFLLTEGLRAVVEYGTGRRARIGRPAAGKTGTSNDFRDAWFIGYTPDLAAAVWLGDDKRRPMAGVAGGSLPAQAWGEFMRAAMRGKPPADFTVPPGIVSVEVCATSGDTATPFCPVTMPRYFPAYRIPPECPEHYYGYHNGSVPEIFVEPDAETAPEPIEPEPEDSAPESEIPVPSLPGDNDLAVEPDLRDPPAPEIDTAPGAEPGPGELIEDGGGSIPDTPDGRAPEKIDKTLPPLPVETESETPGRMQSFLNWLRSLLNW
jgi:penicillin-binding protein 1A